MSHSQFCFLHTHTHTYTQFKKISPCAADEMFFMSLAACCLQLPLIQIGGFHHYWSVWLADCPCHPPHPVVLHIQLVFISSQGNVTHRSKTPKRVLTFFLWWSRHKFLHFSHARCFCFFVFLHAENAILVKQLVFEAEISQWQHNLPSLSHWLLSMILSNYYLQWSPPFTLLLRSNVCMCRSLPYVCVAEILLSYVYFDDKLHKSRLKILSWFPSMNQNQTWTESKVVSV